MGHHFCNPKSAPDEAIAVARAAIAGGEPVNLDALAALAAEAGLQPWRDLPCLAVDPGANRYTHLVCSRVVGHDGDHGNDRFTWPQECPACGGTGWVRVPADSPLYPLFGDRRTLCSVCVSFDNRD